ncbi:hypothetical protein SEPCBS57363_004953 [Sporothrix epigloea]|uniref:F-box domain-containing protein n=1 Tax=Sporothrix epigloea TaxID=1892477 RepID=A0ABP0DW20_9PEZI
MSAASDPDSPDSLSLLHTQTRTHDFVPPTRPNSTPFPHLELLADDDRCTAYLRGLETETRGSQDSTKFEQLESDTPTVIALSQQTPPIDMMRLSALQGQSESAATAYCSFTSPGVAAEFRDLSSVLDMSAMPSTPSLSPISTVATSPDLHFGLNLDFHLSDLGDKGRQPETKATLPPPARKQTLFLQDLPMEIQELILDHVFDCKVSPMTKSWPDKRLTRMASFTRVWRALIQKRLYCRIKLKATALTLSNTVDHFHRYPHLRLHVKHVELWFPVFELKPALTARCTASRMPTITLDDLSYALYTLPSTNCTLEEAFYVLGTTFPDLSILTLEGGERKKAPQVQHFVHKPMFHDSRRMRSRAISDALADTQSGGPISRPGRSLPRISTVRTLVCKGQWNLIRSDDDFQNIVRALPNLRDWQASYSKPKSKSYLTMATILCKIPTNLTSLDLCLEGDYRQEISFSPCFLKVIRKVHFCTSLAEATPALQRLSYTGRVCRSFFDMAARLADQRTTQLKSVDLTVKNCCRHVNHWHESGSGATDLNFIRAFESLVSSAVRSLSRLKKLEYLRIRYVDLEFPVPPLNPFFLIQNGRASGVWSDAIVADLNRVRPDICWEALSDSIGERMLSMDGRLIIYAAFPKKRVVSLKLSNYAYLRASLATM